MSSLPSLRAIIFDLGGTLIDWPDWDADIERRWGLSYDYLISQFSHENWPDQYTYVQAMRDAEKQHWLLVAEKQGSSTPTALLKAGFERMGRVVSEQEVMAALDGYARALDGWAIVFPDARQTLQTLREGGYRIGLLSNTWWAAQWHNAELATHGLQPFFDTVVYTSDLPHSKPHPSVFLDVAARLHVKPAECVMVGDRLIDDIRGALNVGMRAVWRENTYPWPQPKEIIPTATIKELSELPPLVELWG